MSPRDAEKELVSSWLQGIGLEYAMKTFEAAGIVTPSSLAELEVGYFDALGIKSADDRRKLFYLVQRIKVAVGKKEGATQGLLKDNANDIALAGGAVATELTQTSEKGLPIHGDYSRKNLPSNQRREGKSVFILDSDDESSEGNIGGDSADDELSLVPESGRPRKPSRRIQGKPKQRPVPTKVASSRRSSLARPNAKASSSRSLDSSWITSDSDTTESASSRSRRTSGVPIPLSRRAAKRTTTTSNRAVNHGKSLRTGKTLSSIPSQTVAPGSPLVDLSVTSKLLPNYNSGDIPTRLPQGGSSTPPVDRKLEAEGLPPGRVGTREQDDNHAARSTFSSPSRVSSSDRSPLRDTQQKASQNSRTVEESFKAQVQRLRCANRADHDLFVRSPQLELEGDTIFSDMRIRVAVRKRPMSSSETSTAGGVDVIDTFDYNSHGKILCYHPKTKVDLTKQIETFPFAFDNVFDEICTNADVYRRAIQGLLPGLLVGKWATIFAYGQTNSGKTFTMLGPSVANVSNSSPSSGANLGLYYLAAQDIFKALKKPGVDQFDLRLSLFEIYNGKLFDLLNGRQQIKCLEDAQGRVCFPGLTEHDLPNIEKLMEYVAHSASLRSTGSTSRNVDSSRSHAVLQLHLHRKHSAKEFSRLTFIDLAGSERGVDTHSASKSTRMEGADINTSLLALKEVIRAMAKGDTINHVPFRGSKLTQVLKDSFVGDRSRSVMIACVSPNIDTVDQTLNTLRYADRVKERNPDDGSLGAVTRGGSILIKETSQANVNHSMSPLPNDSTASRLISVNDVLTDPFSSECALSGTTKFCDDVYGIISAHKSSMAVLLEMVKDEMTLVNQADAERDGLDAYVDQLTAIQEKQLDILISLRSRLEQYRMSTKSTAEIDLDGSEDSFEDLRSSL